MANRLAQHKGLTMNQRQRSIWMVVVRLSSLVLLALLPSCARPPAPPVVAAAVSRDAQCAPESPTGEQRVAGERVRALLAREQACAMAAMSGLLDEDRLVQMMACVREILDDGDRETVAFLFRNSQYFPHSTQRILELATEYPWLTPLDEAAGGEAARAQVRQADEALAARVASAAAAWAALDLLERSAEDQWARGEHARALLTLEHACALVAVLGISDEGGHDHLIGVHVGKLFDAGDNDTLALILRNSPWFPQSAHWVLKTAHGRGVPGLTEETVERRRQLWLQLRHADRGLSEHLGPEQP